MSTSPSKKVIIGARTNFSVLMSIQYKRVCAEANVIFAEAWRAQCIMAAS